MMTNFSCRRETGHRDYGDVYVLEVLGEDGRVRQTRMQPTVSLARIHVTGCDQVYRISEDVSSTDEERTESLADMDDMIAEIQAARSRARNQAVMAQSWGR